MSVDNEEKDDDWVENVLVEIGEFRLYQVYMIVLMCFVSILSAGSMFQFLFTSATLQYR